MSGLRWKIAVPVAVILGLSFWLFRVGPDVEVVIPRGTPASEVGNLLARNGVVSSPLLFKAFAKLSRLDRSLKPGTYQLRRRMSSIEALWHIHRGGLDHVTVTIPEGWRAAQIAARLEDLGVASGDEFMDVVMDRRWEGYLYPTTYFLSLDMPAAKVAELMREEFLRQAGPLLQRPLPPLLTPEAVVTLASIVEREAVRPEEKPLIARVYLNRLEKHWPLEADPTVQYALGYWKKGLIYKDLEVNSPYNTYRHAGLPPGPICSPSSGSVAAVFEPAVSDALYFVADAAGGHTFHKNFADHLKAKQKMKAELKRQRAAAKTAR